MGLYQINTFTFTLSSSVVQYGALPHFLVQWRSITSNRLVLIMVKGHHVQYRAKLLLFCNFSWCNIKTALVHHPVIQKEAWELLEKLVVNHQLVVLVSIPMCLWFLSVCVVYILLFIWKKVYCYMHIHSFRMPTIKQVWQLIQQVD